jgi:hypothetical protein
MFSIMPQLKCFFNQGSIRHNWPANMPDAMHFRREFAEKVMPNVKYEE